MQRIASVVVTLCLLLVAVPAVAQERVDELPPVRNASAFRYEGTVLFNNVAFTVDKGEVAAPGRAHFVFRALAVGDQPERTVEVILYDGATYIREGTSTQWYVQEQIPDDVGGPPPPDLTAEIAGVGTSGPVTRIGSMPIAGTQTDHYQVWVADDLEQFAPPEVTVEVAKFDIWIGQAINYLNQFQFTIVASDPETGPVQFVFVARLYDFEATNIVVAPPANAQPRQAMPGLITPLQGRGLLSTLMAPLGVPELRTLALERVTR